jgi:hypothetical protein
VNTSKKKKQHKLKRQMQSIRKANAKEQGQNGEARFAAMQLINDPQAFAEVGLYKLTLTVCTYCTWYSYRVNQVETHSLKGAWFQAFAFQLATCAATPRGCSTACRVEARSSSTPRCSSSKSCRAWWACTGKAWRFFHHIILQCYFAVPKSPRHFAVLFCSPQDSN